MLEREKNKMQKKVMVTFVKIGFNCEIGSNPP